MVSKLIQKMSKSIQFPTDMLKQLETLAKELGMTRLHAGIEAGDVSKIVVRLAMFGLANCEDFKKWHVGRKGKQS